ncbi:MAG TPA: glycine betaine ABC transporter substrate-binding protein, partial [Planococcus sp. (in: firmicutes)]|nr:glycine betaine ABC transporter substrate-binding protein [Planococcus sp. (in: firmicutes)]
LPLVRTAILEEFPELEDALLQLAGKIDEPTMQAMNAQVDNDGQMVEVVAGEFLQQAGLKDSE